MSPHTLLHTILCRVPIYSFKSSQSKRKEQIIFAKTDKKSFDECATDPLSSLVSQLESLSISATAFLQPQSGLSPLGSSPGTWAEVRKSLHQADCLGPHNCHTILYINEQAIQNKIYLNATCCESIPMTSSIHTLHNIKKRLLCSKM